MQKLKLAAITISLVLSSFAPAFAFASDWQFVTPEQEGFSSARLEDVGKLAATIHSPAGMVVVNGNVIYTWGDITQKMWIHSCRKSFLSGLIGIAVANGTIDLSQTLGELGVDDIAPSLTAVEKTATLQNLIEARSGIYHFAADETPSMSTGRPDRGSHAPGTFWYYNNWDFNALGGIFEQLTGTSVFTALYAQIALPIGMQDYTPADGYDSYDLTLSKYPGYLLNLSTRDFARYGQLYLQNGNWNGQQVIPASWIQQSLTRASDAGSPAGTGYGYLWWLGSASGGLVDHVNLGDGAFAAEGYGGHYLIVIPKLNMVVVTRADDQWFNQDVTDRSIGPNREGQLLSTILSAQE